MTEIVRVRDLPDLMSTRSPHPVLWCSGCCGAYSANAGDYGAWNGHPPDKILKCGECGALLALRIERRTMVPWSPPKPLKKANLRGV